jgi:hypothetical protein
MTPYTLQLLILAAAYVLACGLAAASLGAAWLVHKASSRVSVSRSARSKVTTLENDLSSLQDQVTRLSRRWNKRLRDEKAEEASPTETGPTTMDDDDRQRADILRRFG